MVTAIVRESGCERGGRAAILCKVSWTIKSRQISWLRFELKKPLGLCLNPINNSWRILSKILPQLKKNPFRIRIW